MVLVNEVKFNGIVKSEEVTTNERFKCFNGVQYREVREDRHLKGLDDETLSRIEVIRYIGNEGMMAKVVDVFQNGKNVWHKETSSLRDETELDQFNRTWISAWKQE